MDEVPIPSILPESLDPSKQLIGFAGKDKLKEAFDEVLPDMQGVCDYIEKFRAVHGMNGSTIEPVIPLLKIGGMSSRRIAKETMAALIEIMKRQIATLEQEQLDAILDKCYSFLTVPELAPVAIAVLERLRYVDPDIWSQIVINGLDESPYTDLPLSIKRRIWASELSAFEHEVTKLVERVSEPEHPASLDHLHFSVERQKQRRENSLVKDLLRLVQGSEEDLVANVVEKMVDIATKEEVSAKRTGIANLFHDFMIMLNLKSSQSLNENLHALRKMARFLEGTQDVAADSEMLTKIRSAISGDGSGGPVALLVASTYSRDYLAQQLVSTLQSRRGPIGNGEDKNILEDAADHLREDPWITDLTFLCLCNMRVGQLLAESKIPTDAETDAPFLLFYPLVIGEMDSDIARLEDDFYTQNGLLPNQKILEMVQSGWLERRVITSYCMALYSHGNVVGLSRFRVVLDKCYATSNSHEEPRESALAYHLLVLSMDEMYSGRAG